MRECQTGDKVVMVSESLKRKTKEFNSILFTGNNGIVTFLVVWRLFRDFFFEEDDSWRKEQTSYKPGVRVVTVISLEVNHPIVRVRPTIPLFNIIMNDSRTLIPTPTPSVHPSSH